MENYKITEINVNEIEPHPNNPRKDIGDVTELSESIKRDGIRQNLTVIPYESGYRCLIGHRRLAAAKLVGLERVPCTIEKEDMPLIDQIAVMLAENMQRADLTSAEEAESMQMMLDLGDTVDSIAEKTGLSKSTVYRRINPLKEYGEKAIKAFERGASFGDFEKLNNISDPERRQEIAESIGTNNFNYKYESACRDEENKKKLETIIKELGKFAIRKNEINRLETEFIRSYYPSVNDNVIKKPDDNGNIKYFYIVNSYCVDLYRDLTAEERKKREISNKEASKREEQSKKAAEARGKFKEIAETCYNLRKNFVKDCNPLKGCNLQQAQLAVYKQLCGYFVNAVIHGYLEYCEQEDFMDYIGMEATEEFDEMEVEQQNEAITLHVCKAKNWEIKTMLAALMAIVDESNLSYNDWYGKHAPCQRLDFVYEVLCAFGYEMSDTEKSLQDGTHELYVKE